MLSGSRIRELPADAPFPANAATEPKKALAALRPLNIGWLLYVEVQIHWSRFTFAPDVVTVRCFDPSGKQHWKEESSNRFADSAEHSLRIVADKISQRLEKRRGQACLRP